ncbi:Protein early flowering 4 [Vitis vinifera]|uniref:Protein early flowering 4 n=1 Tax=Vitis vinifera TaxID=29760 RepID=A0A438E3T6_VITVI|nr:Protein early flowering 4 [Vitis vinifera]
MDSAATAAVAVDEAPRPLITVEQVQSVLDRNRVLIQQVNENHQSKIPDNLVKNVALIQEINGNISKVVSLYSDLSTNFSGVFHQPNENENGAVVAKKGSVKGKNTEA